MRIVTRLFVANAAVIITLVVLAGVLAYGSVERGFISYVQDLELSRLQGPRERLVDIYASDRSWDRVASHPELWGDLMRREPEENRPEDRPSRRDQWRAASGRPPEGSANPEPRVPQERRSRDPLGIPPRAALFDADRNRIAGADIVAEGTPLLPIEVEGEVVGYLGLRPIDRLEDELDLDYLASFRRGLVAMAGTGMLLALLVTLVVSRRVLQPVRRLNDATARLREGDYTITLRDDANDELGALARDFNALARTLDAARRRQAEWIAEASHELRTPLAVLRAYVEALEDGVREPGAESYAAMRDQLAALTKLTDDLHDLASLDARGLALSLAPIDPLAVLRRVFTTFEGRMGEAGLDGELALPAESVTVNGDPMRLAQLLTNLLENSCRYTDPGGRVTASARVLAGRVVLSVDDGPPGVSGENLETIFAPFHREEPSRSRAHGGSGLGLAICARIVAAMHGTIVAKHGSNGGLRVEIELPTC